MATVSDISRGNFVRYNGELMLVLEYEHRTPGNLRAFYQVKLRNVRSGKLAEERFRPGDSIEIVRVETKDYQYLYRDGESFVFMDNETYDQVYVPEVVLGEGAGFLKEGIKVIISFDGDTPVSAELPANVELEITYTEPGIAGDTATKSLKAATVETGATIKVPLFINIGEVVIVNTVTGEYKGRVK
jgi:elongation factor P